MNPVSDSLGQNLHNLLENLLCNIMGNLEKTHHRQTYSKGGLLSSYKTIKKTFTLQKTTQLKLNTTIMKYILASIFVSVFVALTSAMPRYVLIPVEDVAFLQPQNHRVARAAWPQGPGPAPKGRPGFALPPEILAAEEQIASGR